MLSVPGLRIFELIADDREIVDWRGLLDERSCVVFVFYSALDMAESVMKFLEL